MQYRPRVLVIDDEILVRDAMRILLTKYCDVTVASNGREGVRLAMDGDFDLAIVDMRMPGLSGIDTLQKLKETRPETEVLMMTAGDYEQELVKGAMQLGAADYILKPIRAEALRSHISEVMRHRRALQQRRLN